MAQFDEELSRKADELRRAATDITRDLRKFAANLQEEMVVFTEDLRKRARGAPPFELTAIEKIRQLAELRDEGIIAEDEFQEQKKRLLDQV